MSRTVIQVLTENGIPFKQSGEHHHAREGWVQIDCEWCSPGWEKYRFGIPLDRPYYGVCWACGSHRLDEALSTKLEISIVNARRLLDGLERGYALPMREKRNTLILPHGLRDMMPVHRRYLERRGYDPDKMASLWGVRAIGNESELGWRLWLPVHYQGEVVSWTTRGITEYAKLRYINARPDQEILSPKTLLFGEDYVRGNTIIIVEGPFDVYRIGPGAVATMGLSYSREQLLRMSRYKNRVVCFDSEKVANKVARKLCHQLEVFPGNTYRVELESGKDADTANKKEIKELRKRFL